MLLGALLEHFWSPSSRTGSVITILPVLTRSGIFCTALPARAQMVRDQFGPEVAQAVLGHGCLKATEIYAKKRLGLAMELAAKCG